jgi:hypothetical protein
MSIRLPTVTDAVAFGSTGTPTTLDMSSFSVTGLAYQHTIPSGQFEALFAMSKRFSGGQYLFQGNDSGGFWRTDANGTQDVSATHPPNATWFQFALRGDLAGGHMYSRWKLIGDTSWHTVDLATSSFAFTPDVITLGNDEWSSSFGSFSLSNVRVWNAGLTDAELLAEADSSAAIITSNLWAWWKLLSSNLLADASGHGRDLTAIGTGVVAGADSPLEAPGSGVSATGVVTIPYSATGTAAVRTKASGAATLLSVTTSGTATSGSTTGSIAHLLGCLRGGFIGFAR